ncbi:hypothetical protein B0I72DRAFT_141541 [Yarrowia lipolytica]|jgi:hypothetical protein|uniref:YALI0C05819p n=2 Tax=Yarrowia lipolytica TaxID=4952 RepID=Q6CCX2_YARLI|nr:YALI0C05819p [Yarrowia lipolytica CLIB122]AOW02394.1 hypothetical protein YALI1_C07495g [Yarrowia lipolytica]KAB8283138.1 hypothetical protein BKA91DRAFT_137198 [Yarrowia lipolytica]KAE8173943.1 hypothetical protein BKA90DRAFT_134920 [Yarrowia lipolytica]KAJ8053106.1 hypothetical protein LXG23DRAFT_23016 [Yarrowia lipolytica]QNP96442.1 Chaperone protein DnaJ [Yarrowia lipolytica]|eukprot:XP_501490.1 YALI0C05819p [Yarrowia lipolytica CLIB122]
MLISSVAVWSILPSVLAPIIQWIYEKMKYPVGERPTIKSKQNLRQRIILTIGIFLLAFRVAQGYYDVTKDNSDLSYQQSHYHALNLTSTALPRDIRRQYKKLSVTNHPDKARSLGKDPKQAEDDFIELKTSYEILSDPKLKFGYDRFGPTFVDKIKQLIKQQEEGSHFESKSQKSKKQKEESAISDWEVLSTGVKNAMAEHGLTFAVLLFLWVFGMAPTGRFWRFYFLGCQVLIELTIYTRPEDNRIIQVLEWFHAYGFLKKIQLPYQLISVLRKILPEFLLGAMQLYLPLIELFFGHKKADEIRQTSIAKTGKLKPQDIENVSTLVDQVYFEAKNALDWELIAFPSEQSRKDVRDQTIQDMMVMKVDEDPEVKEAYRELNVPV